MEFGRLHVVRPILIALAFLYESPSFGSVGKACRTLLEQLPEFVHMERPAALRIFSAFVGDSADPHEQLQDAIVNYKGAARRPDFAVSTVHRSKGFAFDNVLISNVSETHFPDNRYGRRLLYVALSRCSKSLTILVPAAGASGLITRSAS
jgi:superfamily I DNA/RNA helicase